MNEEPQYNFCPYGGIVCSICKYGVTNTAKFIGKHETQSKIPHVISDIKQRKKLIANFDTFITDLSSSIVSALPDEDAVRIIVFTYFDDPRYIPRPFLSSNRVCTTSTYAK